MWLGALQSVLRRAQPANGKSPLENRAYWMDRMRTAYLIIACLLLLPMPAAAAGPDKEMELGATIYARCKACHSLTHDRAGPRHCDLLGRKAGSIPGYPYSDAMRNSDIIWTPETLDKFLASPLEYMPETNMGYAGIGDAGERKALIRFLAAANANSPLCN